MIFNSIEFFAFLAVVLVLFWSAPTRRVRNVVLLVGSYVFYGYWDWRFLGLIVISTGADFLIAQRLAVTEQDAARKRWLFLSLGINLGILGFFKYFDFFIDSAADVGDRIGVPLDGPALEILLPVGISFYTFQTISYTFDVFRRRIEPERSLLTFAVYVAYFPQLVAGPIERAQHLLPQIQRPAVAPGPEQIRSALLLIGTGIVKKVLIADAVAPLVDDAFVDPARAGSATLALGVVAFSIQIYGDFSGYSSIARGTSRLFGIELIRNFEQPYLSTNITQFWRTWHISLSNWLHDYLYVPLGGNRGSRLATYRNLFLTMVLGGLWHGASWNFVVWGALHGVALAVHRAMGAYEERGRPGMPRHRSAKRSTTCGVSSRSGASSFRGRTSGSPTYSSSPSRPLRSSGWISSTGEGSSGRPSPRGARFDGVPPWVPPRRCCSCGPADPPSPSSTSSSDPRRRRTAAAEVPSPTTRLTPGSTWASVDRVLGGGRVGTGIRCDEAHDDG